MEEQIANVVLIISTFLVIAVFSSMILKKINFPYTIGLVLVGGLWGALSIYYQVFNLFKSIELSPGIILYIVLPTLIFEAAINIDLQVLKKNIIPILLLAVFGLLISTAIIGVGVAYFTPLSLLGALVFGALISATDPVAVIALFNEIGAPKRLVTLIDGESIFNDATAIVAFTIIMGIATGEAQTSVLEASFDFIKVLAGGLLLGLIIGCLGSFINSLGKKNLFLQITVSLVMAYLSFIIADHFFGFSGVMSTLAAGLVMRSRAEKVVDRHNLETLEEFWEYFSFVANSLVFLLLGLTELHIFSNEISFSSGFITAAVTIIIVIAARFVGVYTLLPFYNLINKNNKTNKISLGFQHILFWGGLRGAVPVALVLAIPHDFPHRNLIVHFTFDFILFTLLIQGTTIRKLMSFLGIRPEETDFGDKKIESLDFDFNNKGLAELVMHNLYAQFDEEGFFIKNKSTADGFMYLMKRADLMFQIDQDGARITLVTEPKDIVYFRTVLSEALLNLDKSVRHIRSVINPEKLKDIASTDTQAGPIEQPKSAFNLMKYLSVDKMIINITSRDKESIIRELVQNVVQSGAIAKEYYENVLDQVLDREKSMSTGLGNEIAFPHTKSEYVKDNIILIALAPEGVEFDSIDNKPVKIFVLILSPKNNAGPHLQVLASLSRLLSQDSIREDFLVSKSSQELYEKIKMALSLK